jgi:DNA-binding response OmpR family regulator
MLLDFETGEAAAVASLLGERGFTASALSETAARAASDSAFDVVLISARPRQVSRAIALCADLRLSGYRGAIVVLGARDRLDEGLAALEQGADDFVPRPFVAQQLVARLRAVLRRVDSHSRVRFGPIVVDRAERSAAINGRPLRLTAREYGLLACLTEANGRVVTRAQLFERVWRGSTDTGSNLIEAHMSRLRDKLGSEASMIETVRRAGYRLRVVVTG